MSAELSLVRCFCLEMHYLRGRGVCYSNMFLGSGGIISRISVSFLVLLFLLRSLLLVHRYSWLWVILMYVSYCVLGL